MQLGMGQQIDLEFMQELQQQRQIHVIVFHDNQDHNLYYLLHISDRKVRAAKHRKFTTTRADMNDAHLRPTSFIVEMFDVWEDIKDLLPGC